MPETLLTTDNSRVIFTNHQGTDLPTLVAIVGIHGNEPASIQAMEALFEPKNKGNFDFKGNVFVLKGNTRALESRQRYISRDLNRIWTHENLHLVRMKHEKAPGFSYPELREMALLDQLINSIIAVYGSGKILFADLHTTSADSCAFLPFNDTLPNRAMARHFPVPLILGIEEYLDGPLMSHINDLGYPALGFEAGKHDDPQSARRHQAFIKLCMHHLAIIHLSPADVLAEEGLLTNDLGIKSGFYEILCRYPIGPDQKFEMKPGFSNFKPVRKGHELAINNGIPVRSQYKGMVFLPLYQSQGEDGFFIVKPVSSFWMGLSKWLRKTFLPKLLPLLPGISQKSHSENRFLVDPRIARWLNKEIFHVLGFRIYYSSPGKNWEIIKRD
ncbi:Succinylglutamate desuccinylase / Aspartoacylase family protein [Cyclobacterium lianum]|uniref:Succinylglutamate desuccinylase / Aspartoacylase family protein n=1 Tax=Cyclobacterium lianum TaxID=388280 RepID=A0A1M7KIY0_9BACT|nr:succinylglutamate desuccinylase/aspartoacylase family protein [Cyclobacterium lianum]SHM64852.1 Succinylglutamate desuccinylase / Aspartoacylase family protein [Cyclobacterium lianum]